MVTFLIYNFPFSWSKKIYVPNLTSSIAAAGKKSTNEETDIVESGIDQAEFKDLSLFKFKELEVATNNFSEINKLGQGGFGPVYKVMVFTD